MNFIRGLVFTFQNLFFQSLKAWCFLLMGLFWVLIHGCYANAQKEGEWHCFHGTDRTNKSDESGLLKEWPPGGPPLKWSVSGLGEGYSCVSVANGYIYTAGMN